MLSFVSGIALMLVQAASPPMDFKPQTEPPASTPTPDSGQPDHAQGPEVSEADTEAQARRLACTMSAWDRGRARYGWRL